MQDDTGKTFPLKPKAAQPQSREDRLKAALKANMARRKVQAKTRATVQSHDKIKDE